jgi:hypothetical protein
LDCDAAERELRIHGDHSSPHTRRVQLLLIDQQIASALRCPMKSEEHSMTKISRWLALFVVAAGAPALQANALKMRTAAVVDGTYVGGGHTTVRIQSADRVTGRYAVIDTADLTFLPLKAPAGAPQTVMVPAGTVLNVRLSEGIDVDSTQAGATFKGRVDDPIMIDGCVVIPRGAAVVIQVASVKQSGTLTGSDRIALKLNSISFDDRVYEVVTEYAVAQGDGEGKRTARKVGGGAGLGAIVGAIADGGKGAAIGAVVGGITGTVVAASGEEHLKLPAETRLQFGLTSAVRVRP